MKTDVDIRQDLLAYIKVSAIKDAISGQVRIIPRSSQSDAEDCIISVLDSDSEQVQDAFVNVNVYVPNIVSGGESVENVSRTKLIATVCSEVLRDFYVGGDWYHLAKQRILPVNGKDEYVINNKIKCRINNE